MKRVCVPTIFLVLTLLLVGCTQQQMVKNFGSTMKVDLPRGEKLVNATWKDDHLWYTTRQERDGEKPEVFTFQESSSYGIAQGKVIFTEH